MKGLKHIDFRERRSAFRPLTAVLVCLALAATAGAGYRFMQNQALQQEVDGLSDQLAQREQALKRAERGSKANSPEQRKVHELVAAQGGAAAKTRPAVLERLEQAWSPKVALLSIAVEGAGKQARIEAVTSDLKQAYIYVERLRNKESKTRATLLRHGIKAGDPNRAVVFSVLVEQS
ncbi:hypothetical protein [Paraherbaspirillum soli]|uniref:Uncharacterized protein n=1 Tax=Paraherbaspirillum soli TaxID=631222 RepID=A0ABW0MF69_9BURK